MEVFMNHKSSLWVVCRPHPLLVLVQSQIYLREHCCTLKLVKQIINTHHQVPILDGHLVQLLVVSTHMLGTTFLLHKQNQSTPYRHTRPNEIFTLKVLELLINLSQLS